MISGRVVLSLYNNPVWDSFRFAITHYDHQEVVAYVHTGVVVLGHLEPRCTGWTVGIHSMDIDWSRASYDKPIPNRITHDL
jgi:hypothetical protein